MFECGVPGKSYFHIGSDINLITVILTGALTAKEFISNAKAITAHQDFRPGMNELIDARTANPDGWYRDVLEFVEYLRNTSDTRGNAGRWAIVVNARTATYGYSRMFRALIETYVPWEIRVFYSLSDAIDWIGCEKRIEDFVEEAVARYTMSDRRSV